MNDPTAPAPDPRDAAIADLKARLEAARLIAELRPIDLDAVDGENSEVDEADCATGACPTR